MGVYSLTLGTLSQGLIFKTNFSFFLFLLSFLYEGHINTFQDIIYLTTFKMSLN